MRTSNGQGVGSNFHSADKKPDVLYASNVSSPLTTSQADFLYLVECHGCRELSQSLKLIHDLALYHSDVPFGVAEKSALFDLKVLWEGFERMQENA
jgi:hypothetical protein